MVVQRAPIVVVNGRLSELPPGDTVEGVVFGNVIAGSGLVGGGDLNSGSKRLDVALSSSPSGLVLTEAYLGSDGVAQVEADKSVISGNAYLAQANESLVSGVAAQGLAEVALASGLVALEDAVDVAAKSNKVDLIADSDLEPGDPVAFNSSSNVVKIVSLTSSDSSESLVASTAVNLNTVNTTDIQVAYEPYQKVTVVLTNEASVEVRTVSREGTTLNVGVNYSLAASGSDNPILTWVDEERKFLCLYRDSTDAKRINGRWFTVVSGNQFNVWDDSRLDTASGTINTCLWNESAKLLSPNFASSTTQTRYLPIRPSFLSTFPSGTFSWDLGVANVWQNAGLHPYYSATYNPALGSGIIFYSNTNNSNAPTAALENLFTNHPNNNATIVVYSGFTLSTVDSSYLSSTYVASNEKVLALYKDGTNTRGVSQFVYLTNADASGSYPSGTILGYNEPTVFTSGNCSYISSVYLPDADRVATAYVDNANSSYTTVCIGIPSGTASGDAMAWLQPSVISSTSSLHTKISYHSDTSNLMVSYVDTTASNSAKIRYIDPLTSFTYQGVNSVNQNNFLGISQTSVSSGDTVTVLLPTAVSSVHSGLTPGLSYYVDAVSGTFTTASYKPVSWSGGKDWRPVAKAVSSTELLLLNDL